MSTTRRRFLAASAATAAGTIAFPAIRLSGAEAAGKTIRLGHIGTGGQGTGLLQAFLSVPNTKSVAIADPFRDRREAAARRVKDNQGHEPKLYHDFRDMLADESIDAVIIATPDHWHVPIGLAAVRAGKDVYIEKPLGYTLAQNKAMMDACKEHGRVFQYGTQQRSQEIMRRGVELVLNGRIGKLERIEIWAPRGAGGGSLDEIPVPDGLDYDLYIGPAPMKPCTKDRITSAASWHCSDYALGFIAGWGAHPLDIALWGQDFDMAGPYRLRGSGKADTPDALFDTISSWDVDITFHGGLKARFMSDDIAKPVVAQYRKNWAADGTTFFGSDGWISLSRGRYDASDLSLLRESPGDDAKRVYYRKNYYAGFIEAVRRDGESLCPVADAVRSDALSHLSVLAIQSGEEVIWDPNAYRIISPEALNEKMARPVRGDWQQA